MQTTKLWAVFGSCLLIFASALPSAAQDQAHLSMDASKMGAKIDCNLFGQFAENHGRSPAAVKLQDGRLALSLAPKSVTLVSIGP